MHKGEAIIMFISALLFGIFIGMAIAPIQKSEAKLYKCQEELEITYKILENPHHCVSVCTELYEQED